MGISARTRATSVALALVTSVALAACYAPAPRSGTSPTVTELPPGTTPNIPSSTEPFTPTPQTTETVPVAQGDAGLALVNASYDMDSDSISVTGMLADRITGSGSCELTVRRGAESLSATAASLPDATVTYCSVTVPLPADPAGTWIYTLTYTDATDTGALTGVVDAS